ncbi:MAG TPA: hypothetical protein PLH43_04160 [Acetivibrio sp.]|uniref:hypothetical protein n=1 Tax=Acetivibrio sp. TaxID=1872092 RepID=UPI002D1D581B|nr:hypothetical protein [Acetivibrio sp.]HOM02004.1 hypothetical protein [Acetivibrio sp.]
MRTPDIEAVISFLKTEDGGRSRPCTSGYRPAHLIKDDYLTTGTHNYFGKDEVLPGETVTGTITFITPEAYPQSLWEGKVINIQEGSMIIGYAKVTKVMNELLKFEE